MHAKSILAVLLLVSPGIALAQGDGGTETIDATPTADPTPYRPTTSAPADETPAKSEAGLATDRGWDSTWALIFGINNFIGSAAGFFSAPQPGGSLGGEYFLGNDSGLRGMVTLTHQIAEPTTTKTTIEGGSVPVTTYQFSPPSNTAATNMVFRVDYLYRLFNYAIAPYLGAGAFLNWSRSGLSTKDEVSIVDQITSRERSTINTSFGARGFIGAEWRLHPSFGLFIESEILATIFSNTSFSDVQTVETTVGGARTVTKTTTQSKTPVWFPFFGTNGLVFGAQLGLQVHFQ